MVTDYKQVMRDRTTGSEIFGAWMKDITCWTVARFRNPWPNKVFKDRRRAGVRQKKNLSKTNSSKEIRTRLRLTSHGSSVLNLSKFDESWTVGFDWSSEKSQHENTRRKMTRTKQHRRSKSWGWQGGCQLLAFLKFFLTPSAVQLTPSTHPLYEMIWVSNYTTVWSGSVKTASCRCSVPTPLPIHHPHTYTRPHSRRHNQSRSPHMHLAPTFHTLVNEVKIAFIIARKEIM